ncbi:MAG: hypothetical protein MJ252_29885 [archaeon]|nr:hypothetical protein [archaeon]
MYTIFVNLVSAHFESLIKEYELNPEDSLLYSIQNSLIFFMVIVLNLEDDLFKVLFTMKDKLLINMLSHIIDKFINNKKEKFLGLMVANICYGEYKTKCIRIGEKFFYEIFMAIGSKCCEYPDAILNMHGINQIVNDIIEFKIDLNKIQKINYSRSYTAGGIIIQCLIILLMSINSIDENLGSSEANITVKTNSTTENIKVDIYKFFEDMIGKHIQLTKSSVDNKISSLFRKDDLANYLIKNIFFLFGGQYYIDAFYLPLKFRLEKFEKEIEVKEFESFLDEFLYNVFKLLPEQLRIILFIVQNRVEEEYEKDNLSPMFTVLFFNFLTSPKTQENFGLGFSTYKSIKNINRLIRNICFNTPFAEKDELFPFNNTISKYYQIIFGLYQKEIAEFAKSKTKDEINDLLSHFLKRRDFILPTFVICFSWTVVSSAFDLRNKGILHIYREK